MNEFEPEGRDQLPSQALSKRRSFLTLGGAGLIAMLAAPASSQAKPKNRRRRRQRDDDACPPMVENCSDDIARTCTRQQDECNAFFAPLCADEDAPRNCADALAICCESLGMCQATAFLDCFMRIIRPLEEPV